MSIHCKTILKLIVAAALFTVCAAGAAAQSGRGTMSGIVLGDSDAQGLKGAEVILAGDPDNPRLKDIKLVATTDAIGRYSFAAIPYGSYTFHVSFNGYEDYEIRVYIPSDTQTMIHVRLKKIPIAVE